MCSPHRRPLLVVALLCALTAPSARPAGAVEGDGAGDTAISARVARLYQDAVVVTQRYEKGRQEAEAQRARTRRLEALLVRERRELGVLRDGLGRIARAQYRSGGGLPLTARIVLARSPEELMRGQHLFSQESLVLDNALDRSRRAEARLTADEARAASAWRSLRKRSTELAAMKDALQRLLEEARGQLQGRADAAAAAGACRGAVRLDQPPARPASGWVAPVEDYVLSAGFGSGGTRWANRHTGQDFAVPIGTPVRAVGAGRVVRVSCGGPFGMEVVIEHAGGYWTQYAHLAAVAVDRGQRVTTGQWIGQSGTTGNSTGPHLHLEVRVTPEAGSAVDPVPWLTARGVPLGQ
ncbi:M23 family metallopeptidase [Streptomyces sp. NPDC020996]|uniref:M23 family metallopeptidase n=1 Tax=Streptomyces sp. NPDC020996 TaxID=3154791 RepID=UPI0033EFAA40